MKKLNTKSKFAALAAMAIISVAAIWTFNIRVSARPTPRCPSTCAAIFSFGMLGITAQQTARFSVVNTKTCPPAHPCAPAQVELRFVNSNGTPVTNSDGYPIGTSTVTLAPGQSTFQDLNGSSLILQCPGGCAYGRAQFRAEMPSCVGCGNGNGKGTVLATLEIFDNLTGKTTLGMPDYPAISSHGDDDDR